MREFDIYCTSLARSHRLASGFSRAQSTNGSDGLHRQCQYAKEFISGEKREPMYAPFSIMYWWIEDDRLSRYVSSDSSLEDT